MLQRLHIQNYAIIDEIDVLFSPNLNIITGETGAGKSILMGALSLILGERADTGILKFTDKKCVVEGNFLMEGKGVVKAFLEGNDFEISNELIIRREISPAGKSRGFINDTPATLLQLKQLASLLVDLHRQFDTLELGDADFQRQVMDALAKNDDKLNTYQQLFRQWQSSQQQLQKLQGQKNNFTKEFDYNNFLYTELSDANLKENELEELDAELQLLSNSEEIKSALSKTYYALKEGEQPIVSTLRQLANQLQHYHLYHTQLPQLVQRLQSTQVELQDIADEVESINDAVHFDAERIEWINERLATGYRLLKKHGVQTTTELLQIHADLYQKLQAVLNIDESIANKEKEVTDLFKQATTIAKQLHETRCGQAAPLAQQVNKLLVQVGMPNARLKVQITEAPLNSFGSSNIEFLFDANNNNRFEPLRKVASGGELSRLMLCIKSLVAQSVDLPTLIFDEIDTGISGEAAKQVGIIMKQLATQRQVIAITHQPQIAGRADAHFFVYKQLKDNAIKTNIRMLSQEERINAVAQMLSGEKPTAAALENAREMVLS
ncbi:DNA repair protein RecN [Ilyomonas limi]|uniref:DNA repair protein RecN n=1 Tax=Ilyomonas limi TaxID=2575867 RepID=A0A4U3L0A2_9BACT|nr:DNA repair protein RecN [Ilyomonas limi]TKK68240.1 DNA repair protein RecN [Ilyomonas limi]